MISLDINNLAAWASDPWIRYFAIVAIELILTALLLYAAAIARQIQYQQQMNNLRWREIKKNAFDYFMKLTCFLLSLTNTIEKALKKEPNCDSSVHDAWIWFIGLLIYVFGIPYLAFLAIAYI